MSTSQGDFTPPVKAGYESDGPYHRRNWRALTDFLRTNFISEAHMQDGSVSGVKLQDLAVSDAKIESLTVTKLTSGQLSADVLLAGIIKTAETGQRVEIDTNGIRLNDGTADTVNVPVSGESSFTGGITAKSLSSLTSTLGGDTKIDAGGSFIFTSGVADPSSAPTIAWTWDQVTTFSPPTAVRGIDYDATDGQLLVCDPVLNHVSSYNSSSGARNWVMTPTSPNGAIAPYGITRLGSFIYIMGQRGTPGHFWLLKYNQTGGYPTSLADSYDVGYTSGPFVNFDHLAGMTTDGTALKVCWVKNNDDVMVSTWNTSMGVGSTFALDSGFESGDRKIYDIEYQAIDGGTWWIIWANNTTGVFQVSAYTGGPAALTAEDFALPAQSGGIAFDGSVFLTTPVTGTYIRKHTTWRSSQTVEHVKYAWYQNAGTYTSVGSAQSFVTFNQRAKLRVSWPAFPTSVDRVRVYMLENSVNTNPAAAAMKLQGTETGSTQTYSSYSSGGAADPTTNTFPNAVPATLVLPRLSAAPSSPTEGQIYHNLTTHKTQVYDGTTWNNLW